ncbi:MAG: glycosyltransferase family 4 protein [bacterium]
MPGKKQTNIWFINEYAIPPYLRHYYLSKALVKKGYKTVIITATYAHCGFGFPETNNEYTFDSRDGVPYLWVKVPRYRHAHDKRRILKSLVFTARLFKLPLLQMENPDVIVVSSPELFPVIAGYRLAKKLKAKFVFEVRDIWPLTLIELGGYSRYHPFIVLLQWLENFAYRKADAVISLMPNGYEHMKKHGCAKEKYHYIPNGISLEEMEKAEPLDEKIKKLIPKGKFIIGYAGTIGFANALEYLILAAKLLKEKEEIHFLLVGEGKEKERLTRMSRNLQLSNVTFLPAIPKRQVQSLLREFVDVCYIGLRDSPLFRFGISSNKLFDYFCSGKPIIYAVNSINRPVDEAGAGITVPACNPEAIADAVLKLKAMPHQEREEMGRRGKEYVIAHHNWEILAERFLKATVINAS